MSQNVTYLSLRLLAFYDNDIVKRIE